MAIVHGTPQRKTTKAGSARVVVTDLLKLGDYMCQSTFLLTAPNIGQSFDDVTDKSNHPSVDSNTWTSLTGSTFRILHSGLAYSSEYQQVQLGIGYILQDLVDFRLWM